MKWLFLALVWAAAGVSWWRWRVMVPVLEEGQTVEIEFRVAQWPKEQWGQQIVAVKNITARLPKEVKVTYGDKVRIVGDLSKKVIRGNDSYFMLTVRDVHILQEKNGLKKALTSLRLRLMGNVERWMPGDKGALAAGILLGGDAGMGETNRNAFRRVGLTHILAASGYNVGVVASWVMSVGWRIWGRRKTIPIVIVCITLYVILAGGSAAVVRAGIMAILTLTALGLGRPAQAGWLLVNGAGLMLIVRPGWWEDVGFQLSVAAMAGLIWVEPKIPGGWKDLKTTLAAWLTTMPIILHYFGNLSVVAPLVNGLILWTIPPVMQITALSVTAGLAWEAAGQGIMMLAWPLLTILIEVTGWVGAQRWSAMEIEKMGWVWVLMYYLTVILILNLKRR